MIVQLSREKREQLSSIILELHGKQGPVSQKKLLSDIETAVKFELRRMVNFGVFKLNIDFELV